MHGLKKTVVIWICCTELNKIIYTTDTFKNIILLNWVKIKLELKDNLLADKMILRKNKTMYNSHSCENKIIFKRD